jgi:hypothetical protein
MVRYLNYRDAEKIVFLFLFDLFYFFICKNKGYYIYSQCDFLLNHTFSFS